MRPLETHLPAALAALALALYGAVPAAAEDPEQLPEGVFAPVLVQAADEGVSVRAEPGFLYRELRRLSRGERVTAVRRSGPWLGLRPEGWVAIADVADASRPLPRQGPALARVKSDGVRVRSGPGTGHEIVGGRAAGDRVEIVERQGDWRRLADGGWVHGSLLEESSRPRVGAPDGAGPVAAAQKVRRWSFMDLNGTLFEVYEIDPRAPLIAGLRAAMRETGVLEDDWTYLRLVISVPDGRFSFRYSPASDGNPVSVTDSKGDRYGSVYAQGPLERIPVHLRGFFQDQVIGPGERFEGLLMFRPTLDAREIESIKMRISGQVHELLETP